MTTVVMSSLSDMAEVKVENDQPDSKPALTPPTSENTDKNPDDSGSELSDLEPEEPPPPEPKHEDTEDEDVVPDHYYEGGKIPVFKPTMAQFRSFPNFIKKIDKYGMRSGIVKVVPPNEWRDALPALDEQVKTIKVKNPITQEFHGTHGTYTQANIEKQRSYNLPQWKELSEESSHQPPAKRGERRRNQEKPTRAASTRLRNSAGTNGGAKRKGPGRPRVRPLPSTVHKHDEAAEEDVEDSRTQTPLTPISPPLRPANLKKEFHSDDESPKPKGRQPKSAQAKSVSSRRQHNRRDQADVVDEEAFKKFDYRVHNQDEWTTERCQELETAYWKSLNFSNPMYGADMPGSLFDDSTKEWNVARLENLLDVLGQNVPGVNTAYLYLGMWKASFAWHLEDVDLYSINYIHFGAPKQWYSISQEDARRFEKAMRDVWPNDAKNCDQFLRHKTYLISPSLLQSQYNIRVNRLVHHEGEFVITFPYGYHSGYNLGYNCAESVNFATDSWLDYGKVARKCNCEADSVWVDVREIERKLKGEPTPEYYEETEDDEDEDGDEEPADLPTPPGSVKGKAKRSHRRKRDKEAKPKIKKLRIKLKALAYEPCILCPNEYKADKLLPTNTGKQAHRLCALYTPETYIDDREDGSEIIGGIAQIDKARFELKCNYCRSKKGSVFQCSQKKCTRAYHATCAAPAGVLVDIGKIPVFDEDGTEYTDTGYDFRCRIHRGKRHKNMNELTLEENCLIKKTALRTSVGEVVQMQYLQGDIFAGVVLENRKSEQTILIEVLPKGDKLEVEYKWLLVFDPKNSQLPSPSEDAKPLPPELARKTRMTAEDPATNGGPKPKDLFCDSDSFRWEEFETCKAFQNPSQVKIDISKPNKLWFYLGQKSTEAKAQYTGDLAIQKNDMNANFLESIRITTMQADAAKRPIQRQSYPASFPSGPSQNALNASRANSLNQQQRAQMNAQTKPSTPKDRPYHGKYAITEDVNHPYQYKPRASTGVNTDTQALRNQRDFQHTGSKQTQYPPYINYNGPNQPYPAYRAPQAPMNSIAPTASMFTGSQATPQSFKGGTDYTGQASHNYQRVPPLNHLPSGLSQHQYIYMSEQQPPKLPQPAAYSRPQAPVANMMAPAPKAPPAITNPTTGPSLSGQQKASEPSIVDVPKKPAAPAIKLKQVSHLKVSQEYFYLHNAEKARPLVYQSPYASGGGFTAEYSPISDAEFTSRPRGPSISEEYLSKQTPSQQEEVNKRLSQDKAKAQQIALEPIKQQTQQQAHHQKSQSQGHAHSRNNSSQKLQYQPQSQHLPMSAVQHPQSPYHPTAPQAYHNPYSSPLPYQQYSHFSGNALHHPSGPSHQYQQLQQYQQSSHSPYTNHQSQPYPNHHFRPNSPPGLQFQSPQDFQAQMQREAQKSAGFDHFFKGMQDAAGVHSRVSGAGGGAGGGVSGSSSYGNEGGGQGSPLRYEMGGAGGEMLPVMHDG